MPITPTVYEKSPIQVYDGDASGYVHRICAAGAPAGSADPMASANKGSLYYRTDASDDEPCLYVKVDADSASDDWVAVLIDKDEAAKTIEADWTWNTSSGILLRDSGQKIYSPAANTGALATAASGDAWQIGDQAGSNYVQVNHRGEMVTEGTGRFEPTGQFAIWDDFTYQTLTEANTPWVLNAGTDPQAIDPAINAQEYGVVRLTTGDDDGTVAVDGSQMVGHIPMQADSLGLVMQARLHINTAITNVSVFVGFTDVTTLEEPFSNAADSITSVCSDGVGFLYDTSATTDEWWTVAVDGDSDDTGNAATGTAPVADTWQKLRVEVDSTGSTIRFYIDDTLEATFSGSFGVSPDVNLYPTICACGDGTASKTVDVDYIWVAHNR